MAIIPKAPAILTARPARNRITGFWIPLHDAFTGLGCGTPGEVIAAGSASGTKWSAQPMMYSFPTDNGNTDRVALLAGHDENGMLDEVMSLSTAPADGTVQTMIAMRLRWGDQQTTQGVMFCYGQNTSPYSMIALQLTTGEVLQLLLRGEGASSVDTLSLTFDSSGGATEFTNAAWRGTNVSLICSLRRTGALEAACEIKAQNDAGSPLHATYTGTLALTGGTDMPGLNGQDPEDHKGLMLGARNGGTVANYFGRGTGNNSAIGNVCGYRTTYAASNVADALASMLEYPHEYVRAWLEA